MGRGTRRPRVARRARGHLKDIIKLEQNEEVPALWNIELETGTRMWVATIVDDLFVLELGPDELDYTTELHEKLSEKYGSLTIERDPKSFYGLTFDWDKVNHRTKISAETKLDQAIVEHFGKPVLEKLHAEGPAAVAKELHIPFGKELEKTLDAMRPSTNDKPTPDQREFRSITGACKFIEYVMPGLSVRNHRCSCVMAAPPLDGLSAAQGVLLSAWLYRTDGITFSRVAAGKHTVDVGLKLQGFNMDKGAAAEIEAGADATAYTATTEPTANDYGSHDVIGLYVTYAGAAIMSQTKRLHIIINSSFGTEAVATSRAADAVSPIVAMARAFGVAPTAPVTIITDSMANANVASGHGSSTRAKHLLRHYHYVLQKVLAKEVAIKHVPDVENPADFLTKWVSEDKHKRSLAYLNGKAALE